MGPECQLDDTWVYPRIGSALTTVGLNDIKVYIACRQNTVAQYIATRPIMEFCLETDWSPGMRLSQRSWEKTALDIMGIRAGNAAAD